MRDIAAGEYVIKYGEIIGRATEDIKKGEWVHTHNVKSHLDESVEYEYNPDYPETAIKTGATFKGFKRKNGRAGIRNEIYVIPTVGCVNDVCRRLEKMAQPLVKGTIDGLFTLNHQFGCSQLGEDNENIKKLLCGVALNPNASFVLFVGLGCENNGLDGIKKYLEPFGRDNIAYFNCQDVDDEIEYGLEILKDFCEKASKLKREDVPVSELCIGLKCGGSDAFSGITANVVCGKLNNIFINNGGSSILTETPEMFGAETILMSRAANKKVFNELVSLINDYKNYFKKYGEAIYENPSPGNKKGGISTLEEKSLGCVQKGGTSTIEDILDYGEYISKNGLNILKGSGNDQVSCTNLTASGANIILFTTGRGTPFGSIVPTLKISSNSNIYKKKNNWIDFNAGRILENMPVNDIVNELFELVINIASGKIQTKNEKNGYREISIFRDGIIL